MRILREGRHHDKETAVNYSLRPRCVLLIRVTDGAEMKRRTVVGVSRTF